MQIEGDFRVAAPPDRVYAFFTDPRKLVDCLDDPHTLDAVDADQFRGTITTGVSFIRGTFRFTGRYEDRVPGHHLKTGLHGTGMGSGLDGVLVADLGAAGGATSVHWQATVTLTGPVATLGERLVRSTVDKKVNSLLENIRKALEAPGA